MGKNRILIVEDEEPIAKMIQMNLTVLDYEIHIFYDGQSVANHMIQDHHYDLAILDIMLPGLDGFELLDIMKRYGIPVIFLTAKDDIQSKITGLKNGAEDYLVKPFEMLELIVRIEKILERCGKMEHKIKVLDLVIDTDSRVVMKAGKEIRLKPMEFDLLCLLVKNKNRAVSREKILNEVWGTDYMGETRTVDVHIGQLRKKLDLSENIKTVSKMGYRFED